MFFKSKQKFRVLIEAENLLMDIHGIQRFGFYTTRYVEAADADEASEHAIHLAQNELFSTGAILNEHGDPPVFSISEISRIDTFRGLNAPGKGFSFHPMGS
jgi:hypothetical protein